MSGCKVADGYGIMLVNCFFYLFLFEVNALWVSNCWFFFQGKLYVDARCRCLLVNPSHLVVCSLGIGLNSCSNEMRIMWWILEGCYALAEFAQKWFESSAYILCVGTAEVIIVVHDKDTIDMWHYFNLIKLDHNNATYRSLKARGKRSSWWILCTCAQAMSYDAYALFKKCLYLAFWVYLLLL